MSLASEMRDMGLARARGVGLGVIGALLGACAFEAEPSGTDGRSEPIIAGTDHGSDPGVVFIVADNALCTGALIAPRVVITAKHCIYDIDPGTIQVGTGQDVFSGTPYADVIEVRTTPTEDIDGQDIALLLLDKAGSIPGYPWVSDAPPKKGDPIHVIGFGQQEVGASGTGASGVKQLGASEILRLYTKEFLIGGPTTCFGDSGAPAFLEDGRIFGMGSRGVAQCGGMSVLTRTDYYSDLIAQAVADTDGALALEASLSKNAAAKELAMPLESSAAATEVESTSDATDSTQSSGGCSIAQAQPLTAAPWLLAVFGVLFLRDRARTQRRPCRVRCLSRRDGA